MSDKSVFIVSFEHILHLFPVLPLLTLNKCHLEKKQVDRSQYSYICVAQLHTNTDKCCCIRAIKMINVHQMKNSLIFAPKSLLVAIFPGKTQGCLISGMVM